jgi:hypothetical protein
LLGVVAKYNARRTVEENRSDGSTSVGAAAMAKKSLKTLQREFLETLPTKTINEFAKDFYFGGATKEDKIRSILQTPAGAGLVNVVLSCDIPIASLKRAAKAVGIDLEGLRRGSDIVDHISSVFSNWEKAHLEGKPLSSVTTSPTDDEYLPETQQKLWDEAARLAQPVLYLKTRKNSKTTTMPVGAWNARRSIKHADGIWLRVDMRHHPNTRLRADGVLVTEVTQNACAGEAQLLQKQSLSVHKGERPLYAEEAWDYPHHEVLQLKGKKVIRELLANDDAAQRDYEDEWWAAVQPTDHLTGTGVYAQLGGWPVTWPEEGANEQIRKHLVVRTYRDAEPWIEVFRTVRRYEVQLRIT